MFISFSVTFHLKGTVRLIRSAEKVDSGIMSHDVDLHHSSCSITRDFHLPLSNGALPVPSMSSLRREGITGTRDRRNKLWSRLPIDRQVRCFCEDFGHDIQAVSWEIGQITLSK